MNHTEALMLLDMLYPTEIDADATFATHEQVMACTVCMLSGLVPDEHFPQTPGLWERPCPRCTNRAVWVTQTRPRT